MNTSFKDEEEPLAYRIGDQPFLGLKIYLDSKPLIPRPETEWWAEQLLQRESADRKVGIRLGLAARSVPTFRSADERSVRLLENPQASLPKAGMPARLAFLDLCAGSGAIGCAALARLPGAQVYFGEIDPAHEATILKNIRENGLDESRAHIHSGDLFEPFGDMQFDIIAANPPYIPEDRKLPPSVADYEPTLALYAGSDGLDLIRRIAAAVRRHLTVNGVLWCECDEANIKAARDLFIAQGLVASILPDQYGIPRIIVVE